MQTLDRAATEQMVAVLRKAKEIHEQHGWCQGLLESLGGQHCAGGSIHAAAFMVGTLHTRYDLEVAALRELGRYVDPDIGSVPFWNDQAGRTADEVSAAFEGCILQLEATL